MVKSVLLDDKVHEQLKEKQRKLKEKKVNITLSDLAGMIINSGVDNVTANEPFLKGE